MWYLVMRRPVKPREEWTVSLDQHLGWMKQQHELGRILFSGPTTDRRFGIYVIRADSKDQAEKIASSDPYPAAGFCAFELFEWEVHRSWAVDRLQRRNYGRTSKVERIRSLHPETRGRNSTAEPGAFERLNFFEQTRLTSVWLRARQKLRPLTS